MKPPLKASLPEYYQSYYDRFSSDDIIAVLRNQTDSDIAFLKNLPLEKETFAYAEGKWTIRELIGHIIDTERIFAYRILRLSRKDNTPLPGFDENEYIRNYDFNRFQLSDLLEEWKVVRKGSLALLEKLTDDELDFIGTANGINISSRMIAFFMMAHAAHHLTILQERYL
jgi:uncharacterized damage-inducible protein DinB